MTQMDVDARLRSEALPLMEAIAEMEPEREIAALDLEVDAYSKSVRPLVRRIASRRRQVDDAQTIRQAIARRARTIVEEPHPPED